MGGGVELHKKLPIVGSTLIYHRKKWSFLFPREASPVFFYPAAATVELGAPLLKKHEFPATMNPKFSKLQIVLFKAAVNEIWVYLIGSYGIFQAECCV